MKTICVETNDFFKRKEHVAKQSSIFFTEIQIFENSDDMRETLKSI